MNFSSTNVYNLNLVLYCGINCMETAASVSRSELLEFPYNERTNVDMKLKKINVKLPTKRNFENLSANVIGSV